MKRLTAILLFFFLVSESNAAGEGGTLLLSGRRAERGYQYNPTAFILSDSLQEGSVAFRYHAFGGESLHSLFEGKSGYSTEADAAGYKIVPGKGVYSGAASWKKTQNRDVRWVNVRDAERLYPYLVADSLGGNYHGEQYTLEGSWAVCAGRSVIGLRGKYRGEVAFRPADPRPRNTTSELTLNPGALWQTDLRYAGLFFSYTFYRQHLTTQIAEAQRKDMFYVLTGMGFYDRYHSSVRNEFSRYYRSHSYQAGVQAGHKGDGLSGLAAYTRENTEVEEWDYRKPFRLESSRLEFSLAWQTSPGKSVVLLKADGQARQRNGTERAFEQIRTDQEGSSFIWQLLTESRKFRQTNLAGQLSMLVRHKRTEATTWWLGAEALWQQEKERYLLPEHLKELSDISGNFRIGFRHATKGRHLEAELRGGYRKNLAASLAAPDGQIIVDNMLLPEYDYRRQSYGSGGLRVEYSFPVYGQTALALYSDSQGAYSEKNRYRWQTEAGIRIEF